MVSGGQLVDSSDPIVKGRERFFEPVETYMDNRAGRDVEQATAAPGERRSRGRARKASNGNGAKDETTAESEGSED